MITTLNKLIGIFIVLASFSGVHFSSVVSSSHGSHHQQSANTSCQVLCQCTRPEKRITNLKKIENEKKKKLPSDLFGSIQYPIQLLGKSLGHFLEVWKMSSWRPPDLTLLQGRLGTSL